MSLQSVNPAKIVWQKNLHTKTQMKWRKFKWKQKDSARSVYKEVWRIQLRLKSFKAINNECEKDPPNEKKILKREGKKHKTVNNRRYAFLLSTLIPNLITIGKGVRPKSWVSRYIYKLPKAQVKTKSSAKR